MNETIFDDKTSIQTISIDNVYAGYNPKQSVVKGVSFTAHAGELTILIGSNGCGKSTLLKSVARILHPTQGTVSINGQSIHHIPTKKLAKKMALLPQGPVAPEGLTVHELVSQGRFPHQSLLQQWSEEDSAAVTKAMEDTEILEFAHRPVASLSGGQRQRVWIAMTLAQNTDIIILDEPTTFLDLKIQVDIMTLLQKIAHEQNRILIVVLHDLNIVSSFADNIIMMQDGVLIASGDPKTIITPNNLKSVFDLNAKVIEAPETRKPVCIPVIAYA